MDGKFGGVDRNKVLMNWAGINWHIEVYQKASRCSRSFQEVQSSGDGHHHWMRGMCCVPVDCVQSANICMWKSDGVPKDMAFQFNAFLKKRFKLLNDEIESFYCLLCVFRKCLISYLSI